LAPECRVSRPKIRSAQDRYNDDRAIIGIIQDGAIGGQSFVFLAMFRLSKSRHFLSRFLNWSGIG